MAQKTVLLTGAAGRIGAALRPGLRARYAMRLFDLQPIADLEAGETGLVGDITDMAAVEAALNGVDAVVHMAAAVSPAGWDVMKEPNFNGAYTMFEAARRQGVKRFVYASSIHGFGFHKRDRKIGPDCAPRPDSIYGVSKIFGEALGRLYADKHGMEVVCLRIASFLEKPSAPRHIGTWLSIPDGLELIVRAIEAEGVHFEVVWGASANDMQLYDNPGAERIGYRPKDNSARFAAEILQATPAESEPAFERGYHGAFYVARDFTGNPDRID